MKKLMSIAAIALFVTGSSALACGTCGCKPKQAEVKKPACCAKKDALDCCAKKGNKKCVEGCKKECCAKKEAKKCGEGCKKPCCAPKAKKGSCPGH